MPLDLDQFQALYEKWGAMPLGPTRDDFAEQNVLPAVPALLQRVKRAEGMIVSGWEDIHAAARIFVLESRLARLQKAGTAVVEGVNQMRELQPHWLLERVDAFARALEDPVTAPERSDNDE